MVIQRVRVRWSADGRGARAATLRRSLPSVFALPDAPDDSVIVHEVLLDGATGYQPSVWLLAGDDQVQRIGLRVRARTDLFLNCHPAYDIDDQVNLYGGAQGRSLKTLSR